MIRKTDQGAAEIVNEIVTHYQGEVMRSIYREALGKAKPLTRVRYNGFNLSTRTRISKEMSMRSMGIGGSTVGGHYDIIFIDDAVTDRDRYYDRERLKTINFTRGLRQIVNPGGIIRWNGTLWHKGDANNVVAPPPDQDSYWPIGSIRIKGITPDFVRQLKLENTPALYAANYSLKLIEDAHPEFGPALHGELTEEQWKKVKTVAAIDPAYDGTDCIGLAIGGHVDGKFFVRYGRVWRNNIADKYHELVEIMQAMGVSQLCVETNSDKGLSYREFRKLCPWMVKPVDNRANKYQRITTTLKKHWQHIRFGANASPQFMAHVCEYSEHAEHDDGADALEMLINYFDPQSRVQVGKVRNM